MEPRVSIIIPTFNRTRWLRQAIESALGQTYPRIEVVVVDDGSPADDARQIAASYPAVRYLQQTNSGLGAARNAGMGVSSGQCLVFLDDDDWLAAEAVAERLAVLQAQPDAGLVYSDLFLADSDGRVIARYYSQRARPLPEGDIHACLLRRNFIPVHSVMWRREVVEAVGGFPETRKGAEDWHVLVRATERWQARYVDQPLGYYRLHKHNMSLNFRGQIEGAALTQQYVAQSPRFAALPKRNQAQVLATYAHEQWLAGDPALAKTFLRLAQLADPSGLKSIVLQYGFLLGRPTGRLITRLYWRLRPLVSGQRAAADYFLSKARPFS